jgi:hypothetical protein
MKRRPLESEESREINEIHSFIHSPFSLLASCPSAQIWQADSPTCVQDLKEHKKEIYTIRWAPTGPGSDNPDKKKLFARSVEGNNS